MLKFRVFSVIIMTFSCNTHQFCVRNCRTLTLHVQCTTVQEKNNPIAPYWWQSWSPGDGGVKWYELWILFTTISYYQIVTITRQYGYSGYSQRICTLCVPTRTLWHNGFTDGFTQELSAMHNNNIVCQRYEICDMKY